MWNLAGILVCRVLVSPGPCWSFVEIWSPCLRSTWIPCLLCPGLVEEANSQELFLSSHFPPHFYLILVVFPHGCANLGPFISRIWEHLLAQPLPIPSIPFRVAFAAGIFFFPWCCVIEFRGFSPPADLIPLVLLCRAWLELRNGWDGHWSHPGFTRTWSLALSEFLKLHKPCSAWGKQTGFEAQESPKS